MFKKFASLAATALFMLTGAVYADEASVKKAVETHLETKVDSVKKLPYLGLYEVQTGSDVVYTNEGASYIIIGNIIDTKTKQNLTQARLNQLSTIKFADLPLDLAVKTVRGNGKRVLATFEDPNCGYCKKLAHELQSIDNITIYTFMIPILAADSVEKTKGVWCSADRSKAWYAWMLEGTVPAAGTCDTPTDKVLALSQRLNVRGTPAIFFSNGERVPGFVPAAKLEEKLKQIASAK